MSGFNSKNNININLNIGDQLTSISCGHIVVELIKFIAYQRLQIPYTYQWLKEVVNKRKSCEDVREGHLSERHFFVASTALNNLDFIIKSLLKEIETSIPEEICIVLGGTPITCKEVYRLILPRACHKQQCHSTHIASDQKIQRNVFKTLVTSDKLSQIFFNTLSPTNMYIFIKKNISNNQDVVCADTFLSVDGYRLPRSCKIVCLDFRTQNHQNVSCCHKFQIFGDAINVNIDQLNTDEEVEFNEIESTDDKRWFQSSYIMKGFKDCTVNGSSVTNAWLQY
ncbi:uncharacterized protein LOC112047493 [Bicyclus anynana]|uniref:Uncharacterized protein LOC112047493 n=1 Tax=Bicyclus anynana TaxID=110368 RepID=A0A6J1N5L3_BICAN|nr:uncharacterized protein LOC112047493 [Bicyclus anynana]